MNMKPIVVGVDGSPESARAAALAAWMADRTHTQCHLVHSAADYWSSLTVPEAGVDLAELDRAARVAARRLVDHSLENVVPQAMRRAVEIKVGRAPVVLAETARQLDADMVVLGGKRRRAIARIGGSTITHLVRLGSVPVLAVDGPVHAITRILVAVDLSYAAKPAIDAGERFATMFGARLRIVHSAEPVPVVPGVSMGIPDDEFYRGVEQKVESYIRPLVRVPETEIVVRRGRPAAAIASEATQWRADLIIVGSHGKGWVDRLLIGSTSERLIQVLPAATLVIPVAKPAGAHDELALAELAHAAP